MPECEQTEAELPNIAQVLHIIKYNKAVPTVLPGNFSAMIPVADSDCRQDST